MSFVTICKLKLYLISCYPHFVQYLPKLRSFLPVAQTTWWNEGPNAIFSGGRNLDLFEASLTGVTCHAPPTCSYALSGLAFVECTFFSVIFFFFWDSCLTVNIDGLLHFGAVIYDFSPFQERKRSILVGQFTKLKCGRHWDSRLFLPFVDSQIEVQINF